MARSLDSARVRAEQRVQRFVEAAFELLSDSGPSGDFTVQDVDLLLYGIGSGA